MWSWQAPSASAGEILRIFYVYSLEESPPIYILMVQLTNGQTKQFSDVKELRFYFKNRFDKEAIKEASTQPLTIACQVPDPRKELKSECIIC